MDRYCSKCGEKLILKKKSKPVYSTDLPGQVPFYTVNTYACPNKRFLSFTGHDSYETCEQTEEYIKAKEKYDRTHTLPLSDATLFMGKY